MQNDELIARLQAATANDKRLFEDVWEHLCQTSLEFRRFACTTTDSDGWTQTGRFIRMLDAGAYESAALTLVPSTMNATIDTRKPAAATLGGEWVYAATPALALCIAALKARSHD